MKIPQKEEKRDESLEKAKVSLLAFRENLHKFFPYRADALMDLIDATACNTVLPQVKTGFWVSKTRHFSPPTGTPHTEQLTFAQHPFGTAPLTLSQKATLKYHTKTPSFEGVFALILGFLFLHPTCQTFSNLFQSL